MSEFVTTNGKLGVAQRVVVNGKAWWVAPATSIPRDGVLPGSKGSLLYPHKEIGAVAQEWDKFPITLNHPTDTITGQHLSSRDRPDLHLGHIRDSRYDGIAQRHMLWFDEARTQRLAPQIISNLKSGIPLELSTGLFTENEESPGINHQGKPYTHIARNYRPDHIAILLDSVGACSVADGCGVLMNQKTRAGDPECPT
jgi:hypothetical protein